MNSEDNKLKRFLRMAEVTEKCATAGVISIG